MNVENLLEKLEAISSLLKNSNLRQQTSHLRGIEKVIEEFDILVEKIKSQHDSKTLPKETLQPMLSELVEKLDIISEDCDINLAKLDFIRNLKPLV